MHDESDRSGLVVPVLMGIINVTPDSFSDGGQFQSVQAAVAFGRKLVEQGAHILDVGGESTRPGAEFVSEEEELARVVPVIEALADNVDARISIDTRKSNVAAAAINAGASIWNDVSALTYDEKSLEVASVLGCEIILMHAQGDPETMQKNPQYDDVVTAVYDYLADRIEACVSAGISKSKLIIDPGIGFGKTLEHNLLILAQLDHFTDLGCPLLLGASRKRFIAALDREETAGERLGGSLAAVMAGYQRGVSIFRVHDVAETRQALAVAKAIDAAGKG